MRISDWSSDVCSSDLNMPISENVAARVVGWVKRDAGYIDNIPGTLTFPTSGIVFDNSEFVEDDYNDVDTYGARAALKIDLDDTWTVTPQIMGQYQKSSGFFDKETGRSEERRVGKECVST